MQRSDLERELERLHAESWGWALACVGRDRELAHDVLQTAYVRMLAGVARPTGGSAIRTWVFGVIRVTALEELRRARHDAARRSDGLETAADATLGPDVLTERAERAAVLASALAALSPRQREVLHLVFYHDMTIEDAAHVMNVSLGSARTHYHRGKAALVAELEQLREDVG